MGAMQNNGNPKGTKKSKRGSVKNKDRLAAFGSSAPGGSADWNFCHSELLQAVVVEITKRGGAVVFGLSRDLGAHSCTLMLDDNRKTLWFNGDANLDNELGAVIDMLEALD